VQLHVDGWSFPAEHVREDPLAGYTLRPDDDVPVLGLLHADLDAPASAYAPVSLARLRAQPVALWILGHVHGPALHQSAGGPPVLYPGSPQPMDPGEPGVHGVWMVELKPGTTPEPRQMPLATVRYAPLEIDVTGASDSAALRMLVHEQLRSGAAELVRDGGPLRHLLLRLRVMGSTPIHRTVEREMMAITRDYDGEVDGVTVHVEECATATRPARDLAALARGSDAAAVLARLALDLEGDDAPSAVHGALLHEAEQDAARLRQARGYAAIAARDDGLGGAALRRAMARQAMALLDELLAQREQPA
jgi:DNA repair exonuclease SbcCD nuclease subunit